MKPTPRKCAHIHPRDVRTLGSGWRGGEVARWRGGVGETRSSVETQSVLHTPLRRSNMSQSQRKAKEQQRRTRRENDKDPPKAHHPIEAVSDPPSATDYQFRLCVTESLACRVPIHVNKSRFFWTRNK